MQPAEPPASGGMAAPRLSSVILIAIGAIAVIVIAAIFGYILFLSGMGFSAQLWWMGLSSGIFAVAFYVVYAGTRDKRFSRPLAAAFFVISVGSFYAAVFTNQDSPLLKVIWLVLLSILVVGALVGLFVLIRDAERDAMRKSQRRITP